jgi:hypothetical protein
MPLNHTPVREVPEAAYHARQMSLFRTFLTSSHAAQHDLSNAAAFLDQVPRFAVSRKRMAAMRTPQGHLQPLERTFSFEGRVFEVRIWPAQIRVKDGWQSYFPSAREELVEQALRKLAAVQFDGFFERDRSGVRFTLHQLRTELAEQGHGMKYPDLREALDILSLASIEISPKDGIKNEYSFVRANYLTALTAKGLKDYKNDRSSKWVAEFHPMMAKAIGKIDYRQTNYKRWMGCKSQMARYLYTRLVLKFTQASMMLTYDVSYSTIRKDSGLLDGINRQRQAIAEVDKAWAELAAIGAVRSCVKIIKDGSSNAIEDVVYRIATTQQFVTEQKASNRRLNESRAALCAA